MTYRCAHCKQTHETMAQGRLCSKRQQREKAAAALEPMVVETPAPALNGPVLPDTRVKREDPVALSEAFNATWAHMKNLAAQHEDAQERAVYEQEMKNGHA